MSRRRRASDATKAGRAAIKKHQSIRMKPSRKWPFWICVRRTGKHIYRCDSMEHIRDFVMAYTEGDHYAAWSWCEFAVRCLARDSRTARYLGYDWISTDGARV